MRDERRQGYKHINIRNCNTPILRQDKTREQKVSKDKKKTVEWSGTYGYILSIAHS